MSGKIQKRILNQSAIVVVFIWAALSAAYCFWYYLVSWHIFFFPRTPTAVVNKEQITIKEWGFNSTTVKLDLLIPVTIYNPNYIRLVLVFQKLKFIIRD